MKYQTQLPIFMHESLSWYIDSAHTRTIPYLNVLTNSSNSKENVFGSQSKSDTKKTYNFVSQSKLNTTPPKNHRELSATLEDPSRLLDPLGFRKLILMHWRSSDSPSSHKISSLPKFSWLKYIYLVKTSMYLSMKTIQTTSKKIWLRVNHHGNLWQTDSRCLNLSKTFSKGLEY